MHYYYPYSDARIHNTYLEKEKVKNNIDSGKAHMFKYEYRHDKENETKLNKEEQNDIYDTESDLPF